MIKPIDFDVSTFDPNIDVNALGQAIDSTWGRSSTPRTSSYSVKFTVVGGLLQASYAVVVNFATEYDMIVMKRNYAHESGSVIDKALEEVKKAYKELTGKSLKVKELSSSDSVEIISNSFSNPKRTAYYRRRALFNVTA